MSEEEQYIIETYEDEPSGPYCAACGAELDWEDCDQCGGEGEFDWETLQFDDPLWYDEDSVELCSQCAGKGGWWVCHNGQCTT